MATPISKSIVNYFTKLPSKVSITDENPRKSAPIFNKQHVDEFQLRAEKFDQELSDPSLDTTNTYISCMRSGQHRPYRVSIKTRGSLRARFLQFSEDVRPPYFGTWQKSSKLVTGRKPFGKDDEIFDYELDSEAEWDIGGPGESLKGDDSEDEDEQDDYEIDMKTFVPHGYVSDDEVSDKEDESDNLKCDVKENSKLISIILGLNFDEDPTDSKLQFLRNFQGNSC